MFLPGWDEIMRLKDQLEGSSTFPASRYASGVKCKPCMICFRLGDILVSEWSQAAADIRFRTEHVCSWLRPGHKQPCTGDQCICGVTRSSTR